jgi:hypothetical protein
MTIDQAKAFQVSPNFHLWEFLYSEEAIKHGLIQEQLDIPETFIINLKKLGVNVLSPLRKEFGVSVLVKSGYRCEDLNTIVNGQPNSDHLTGKAADIYIPGKMDLAFHYIKNRCKFKQLINEQNLTWIHVSFDEYNNKMEVFSL